MPGLEILGWVGQHPIPPAIAQALNKVPNFTTVVLRRFGVDSLPSLHLLASKITKLEFETERQAPLVEEVLKLCPDMPGLQRRAKMAWNEHNVATLEEHRETFFRHLPALLSQASANLEELSIDGHGLLEDDKPFPWLQRLFDAMIDDNRQYPAFPRLGGLWLHDCDVDNIGFKHLLKSSAQSLRCLRIDSPGLATLPAPRRPLPSLQELYVNRFSMFCLLCRSCAILCSCHYMEKNVSCVDMVNGITQNSPLKMSAALQLHRWKHSCRLRRAH